MLFDDEYKTIEQTSQGEFRDRGSRFLGYAFPVSSESQVKEILQQIKKEHPSANHHCYGFRIGPGKELFRYSDDREPAGSAGKPIFGVIQSKDLTNILIVVVRYFGGTLLGVPGLIHAYREAAAGSIANATIVSKPIVVRYRIIFDYSLIQDMMSLLKKSDARITGQDMQEQCTVELEISKSLSDKFYREVLNHHLIRDKCNITAI